MVEDDSCVANVCALRFFFSLRVLLYNYFFYEDSVLLTSQIVLEYRFVEAEKISTKDSSIGYGNVDKKQSFNDSIAACFGTSNLKGWQRWKRFVVFLVH
jgi:hypothetical protein